MTSLCGPGDRNFNAVSHKPTRAPIPMFSNHGDWSVVSFAAVFWDVTQRSQKTAAKETNWSAAMREGLRQRNRSMEERYSF